MLWKAFIFSAFLVIVIKGVEFNDFQLGDPFGHFWNWHRRHDLLFPEERLAVTNRDIEEVTQRDRESLGPDYKDPIPSGTDEKPVLKPKPQHPSYNPSVLPGGVVDVDAGIGVGSVPDGLPSSPDGSFSPSSFGLNPFGINHGNGGGLFGLGGFFSSASEFKPWWKGPNVCIEREETTDDEDEAETIETNKNETINDTIEKSPNFFSTAISLSNCQQSPNKYECITKINNHGVVKTFTVRYKCCYGFKRTKGTTGCEKQLELKSLIETIDELGAKEFKNLIQTSNLENLISNGNYTVFVPTDMALNDFSDKLLNLNAVRRRRDVKNPLSSNDLVLSHVTKGFVDLTELVNEEIIYSENNNSSIRINIYPTENYEKMLTANCARVSKVNNLAENGIVHVVDKVAIPATHSIQEIIKQHPQLTNLMKILENTDSLKNFKEQGHYTLFAPADRAFDKLDQVARQKLLDGDSCALSILKHHITSHTICSSAIIGNATTHNVDGEILNTKRTTDDQLILENKAKIFETDIIATNGVIHLIDTLLIPETALHINDVLKNQNFTKFRELIEKSGLANYIENLNNATVFAPSDSAFSEPNAKQVLDEIQKDSEKLRDLINYHVVQGQMQSCDMNNNAMIKTKDHGKQLRVNLYSTLPLFTNVINRATVNCARLTGFDEKSCGSVIHEVNQILLPPTKNILELIAEDERYSTLNKIIKDTEVEKILRDSNQSITLLAPTDETFAGIDEADLNTLLEDKDKANIVIKNHILTEVLCCSGVGPQTWGFNSLVPTISHHHHQVGRTGSHQIRIGRAVVTKCDNLATNGIVHTVNRVLVPQRHHPTNFGGFFLFDF